MAFSMTTAPFWKLTNLIHLELDGNEITGYLPTEMKTMHQLSAFLTGYALVAGILVLLASKHFLTYPILLLYPVTFCITGTKANGSIFDFIVQWPNAITLRLRSPFFSGTIPPMLAHSTSIRWLELDSTSIWGTIPSEIGLMTQLTRLALGAERTDMISVVVDFDNSLMGEKRLEGTIPSELGNMKSLGK